VRAILMYHSLDPSGSPISLDPKVFLQHVKFLAGGSVQVVPLERLPDLPGDQDAVAVTFDDGFRNFATEAAPALRDAGLPVTLFVVSDHLGTNDWGGHPAPGIPTLPLLDWVELGRLTELGVTLGAHTRHHPRLSRLDSSRLEDEIGGSAGKIRDETGQAPRTFAYPYGDFSPEAVAVTSRHYGMACTTELRPIGTEERMYLLPRLDMFYYREPGTLEAWGTPRFRRRLAWRAAARRVRQAFRS
jgi:peptidoglycan/xylan/chitin deacetylase (PgdA/CDA1 family)